MPIQLASFLTPKTGADYPILEDRYLRGGFRAVADVVARDGIGTTSRKAGMFVWTEAEGKLWKLKADLTTFEEWSPGGSKMYTHLQPTASTTWTAPHGKGSDSFVFNIIADGIGFLLPDTIHATDVNTVVSTFNVPLSGKLVLSFN